MLALDAPSFRSRLAAVLLCLVAFTVSSACGGSGALAGDDEPDPVTPEPLAITTTQIPAAIWNEAYAFSFGAKGGNADYAWTLEPGTTLPSGVTFAATGVLQGTPGATGSFPLRVRVTDKQDATATVMRTLSFVVALGIDDLRATPGTQRGTVILRFTAPPAGTEPVTAYEVRASIRHIATPEDLDNAQVIPNSHTPRTPGSLETITLSGLDPGQTLQFAVRPVLSFARGATAYAIASRVGIGTGPMRPTNAVTLSSPGTISTPGTYYLDRDLSTAGTTFTITSGDVTLDLGGHTITYGTGSARAHAVLADGISGQITVRNGTIVQGGGGGTSCHAVRLIAVDEVRVSGVEVTVTGRDADGLSLVTIPKHVRVDHCKVHCRTTQVTDRHFPGVAAIRIDDALGSAEVDHNHITASPQWGMRLQGNSSSGDVLVHHNVVAGTKALVANGYMLGIYKRNADVFENDLRGESRGIHIASDGSDGINCRVHDNLISVQDQTNAEYTDYHWVHGVKIEAAPGCKVYDNVISGIADDQHAEVRGIDIALQNNEDQNISGVEVVRNRVTALAQTARFRANALFWGEGTAGATNDLVVRHNILTATDRVIMREWGGGRGALMRDNVLVRDLGLGAAHEFFVEEFGNGGQPNPGNRFLDCFTDLNLFHVFEYHEAKSYDATREWTLAFLVRDATGAPVPAADVTVNDKNGTRVFQTTTDADGKAQGTVVEAKITNGPAVARLGPFSINVTKSGVGTYQGSMDITARTALVVNLAAGSAIPDTTAPTAPGAVFATPLSASRVLLRWTAATDAVGVAAWLIYVDDELAGITNEMPFVVPGLGAASQHVFQIRALDLGGNLSAPATASATTLAEDRGPAR